VVEIGHTERSDEIGDMARAVVVFRANAIELMHSQQRLAQQATMLEEKLAHEQAITEMQRNFVAMITHEFRTPLTHIDAQAQRLANLKDRLQPQDVETRASRIRAAVMRIVRMIDHLVDTSRLIEADPEQFYHPEAFDLVPVLRDVCRLHREVAPGARIATDFGSPSLTVIGDPKLLFQLFSNLVANAVKYSPAPAQVTVRANVSSDQVTTSVEDGGIGIPTKDLPNIFSRYARGGNVSGFVGTGIGLFVADTVARLHGTEICVESEVGKGSRFSLSLRTA
jgi:signal transduction histidine kinase